MTAQGVAGRPGRSASNGSPLPPLWLAVVVEQACTEIWNAWEEEATVTSLRVSPDVYAAVAVARPGEVQRGYPLMLLGLELVPDEGVDTYEPLVVKEGAC
ncbi:MAG: hypothetical protein GEV03_15605 [Streptosporangiales bacterium]|nr:hypothetical protein [Streptosporangiales bacterium]